MHYSAQHCSLLAHYCLPSLAQPSPAMTNIVVGQRQLPGRHNHLSLDVAKSATRCQLCNTQEGNERCADVNQMSGRGVKVKVLARDKEVPGSQGSTKEVPGDTRVCHGTPTSLPQACPGEDTCQDMNAEADHKHGDSTMRLHKSASQRVSMGESAMLEVCLCACETCLRRACLFHGVSRC